MSVEIKVPTLGESIVEATVGKWMKREGEQVAVGEPLVELETDKVNMEVAATGAGVLRSIVKREGETVVVQTGEGGMVTQLRLRWTPGCHSDTELTSRLRMYPAFFNRVNTARRIGGTERYRARAGAGTYARIRATVRGRRVGARWKGSFSATAKIRRDGRTIDRCRTPRIRWSAKRVEGS
jgi:hypothetical protein